jgi:hypothetical protein
MGAPCKPQAFFSYLKYTLLKERKMRAGPQNEKYEKNINRSHNHVCRVMKRDRYTICEF